MGTISRENDENPGVALGASVSLNYVGTATQAKLVDVIVKDNSENTVVNNVANDNDLQIAGGVTAEFAKGTVGVGAAFALSHENGKPVNSDEKEEEYKPLEIKIDPETGYAIDPNTGDLLDPNTGMPVSSNVSNLPE